MATVSKSPKACSSVAAFSVATRSITLGRNECVQQQVDAG